MLARFRGGPMDGQTRTLPDDQDVYLTSLLRVRAVVEDEEKFTSSRKDVAVYYRTDRIVDGGCLFVFDGGERGRPVPT